MYVLRLQSAALRDCGHARPSGGYFASDDKTAAEAIAGATTPHRCYHRNVRNHVSNSYYLYFPRLIKIIKLFCLRDKMLFLIFRITYNEYIIIIIIIIYFNRIMGPSELVPRVGSIKSINQQLFCYLRFLPTWKWPLWDMNGSMYLYIYILYK